MNNGGGGVAELTEDLSTLLTTYDNKADFLEAAAENEEVADLLGANPSLGDIETAVGTLLGGTVGTLNGQIGVGGTVDPERSDTFNNAIIDEQQEANADRVEEAEEAVADTQGLTQASTALSSAQAGLKAANDRQVSTKASEAGAVAEFNETGAEVEIGGTETVVRLEKDSGYPADAAAADDLDDPSALYTDGAGGATVIEFRDNRVQVTEDYKNVDGISAVVSAVSANITALKRIDTAETNLKAAIEAVLDIENDGWDEERTVTTTETPTFSYTDSNGGAEEANADHVIEDASGNYHVVLTGGDTYAATPTGQGTNTVTFTFNSGDTAGNTTGTTVDETEFNYDVESTQTFTVDAYFSADDVRGDDTYVTDLFFAEADKSAELVQAVAAQTAFNEAVEDYRAAKEIADELEGYNDEIESLVEKIEEEYDVFVRENEVGTSENDAFVFTGEDMDVSSFGAQGDDILYVGDGFTAVDLASGVNIETTRQGESSVLELFIQQQGSDTMIYLESEAFGGSATSGFEGNTITLQNVDAETLQYENGVISIVEVA